MLSHLFHIHRRRKCHISVCGICLFCMILSLVLVTFNIVEQFRAHCVWIWTLPHNLNIRYTIIHFVYVSYILDFFIFLWHYKTSLGCLGYLRFQDTEFIAINFCPKTTLFLHCVSLKLPTKYSGWNWVEHHGHPQGKGYPWKEFQDLFISRLRSVWRGDACLPPSHTCTGGLQDPWKTPQCSGSHQLWGKHPSVFGTQKYISVFPCHWHSDNNLCGHGVGHRKRSRNVPQRDRLSKGGGG